MVVDGGGVSKGGRKKVKMIFSVFVLVVSVDVMLFNERSGKIVSLMGNWGRSERRC